MEFMDTRVGAVTGPNVTLCLTEVDGKWRIVVVRKGREYVGGFPLVFQPIDDDSCLVVKKNMSGLLRDMAKGGAEFEAASKALDKINCVANGRRFEVALEYVLLSWEVAGFNQIYQIRPATAQERLAAEEVSA